MYPPIHLFISCVSSEFKSYRTTLVADLEFPRVRVETQERFAEVPGGDPILLKLDDYIRQCDAVIHLAGDRCGSVASDANRAKLLARYPDLLKKLKLTPAYVDTLTYTQWEAWLALYHDKKLVIAVPKPAVGGSPPPPLADAAAVAARDSQIVHLEQLKTLHTCHPEIEFANSDRLVIPLLKFLHHSYADLLAKKFGTSGGLKERFGAGMVDALKSLLDDLPPFPEGLDHFVTAAYVQITGHLPKNIETSRSPMAAIVDTLAERDSPLDLLALAQRTLWSIKDSAPAEDQAGLHDWLQEALKDCVADKTTPGDDMAHLQRALDGHMTDSKQAWRKTDQTPPRPRLEISFRPSLLADGTVERHAFIRWGRCREEAGLGCSTTGPWQTMVTDTVARILADTTRKQWPYERVEAFVDCRCDHLHHPWEYCPGPGGRHRLHRWPVVLRIPREPMDREYLTAPPPQISRTALSCALDTADAFDQDPCDHGVFFASWIEWSDTRRPLLRTAVESAGIGLWTRGPYDVAFAEKLLQSIENRSIAELPALVHKLRQKSAPTDPDPHLALLFDDKLLPAFEFPAEMSSDQQLATALGLS